MSWVPANGGKVYPDGNDILYPVVSPSDENKLYVEEDVSNIALALGKRLKVSEMADAIEKVVESDGLFPYRGSIDHLDMNIQIVELQ